MKLLFYETRKFIWNKRFFLLLFVALVVNMCKILLFLNDNPLIQSRLTERGDTSYKNFEKSFQGNITEEKGKQIYEGCKRFENFMLGSEPYDIENEYYYRLYDLYKYQYLYPQTINEKIDEARDNIRFYKQRGNRYMEEYNSLFIKIYSGRYIENYYNSEDFAELFHYPFSTFLLLLLGLFSSYYFFYTEKECGMYQTFLTCGRGKRKVFTCKYVTLLLGLLLSGIILYGEDYAIYSMMLNLDGIGNPIYAITDYMLSPLNVSIAAFYFLTSVSKIGIVFLISLIFVLAGQLLDGKISSVMATIILSGIVVFFGDRIFNIQNAWSKLTVVNIFGKPVVLELVKLFVFSFILAVVSICVYKSFGRHKELKLCIRQSGITT